MQTCLKLLLFICVVSSCSQNHTAYIPVYFTGSGFEKQPDSLTTEHIKNIRKVFDYYQITYSADDNGVYYKGPIDQETLWNYTKKASDKSWLANH